MSMCDIDKWALIRHKIETKKKISCLKYRMLFWLSKKSNVSIWYYTAVVDQANIFLIIICSTNSFTSFELTNENERKRNKSASIYDTKLAYHAIHLNIISCVCPTTNSTDLVNRMCWEMHAENYKYTYSSI